MKAFAVMFASALFLPGATALSVDVSAIGATNVTPDLGGTVIVHITMPCSEVLKEAAEGAADPFSQSNRPPVLFWVGTDFGNPGWFTPMTIPPEAEPYVAYYVPDVAYCQSHPSAVLEYDAGFLVQPAWTVQAGTTANFTFYSFLTGTDAWFFGPNPYAEASVVFAADPAAQVIPEPALPPVLAMAGKQAELSARVSVRTNFPAELSLQVGSPQPNAMCNGDEPVIGSQWVTATPGKIAHVAPGPFDLGETMMISVLAEPPRVVAPNREGCMAVQTFAFPVILTPNPPLPDFIEIPRPYAGATWWYMAEASTEGVDATRADRTAGLSAFAVFALLVLAAAAWRRP